MTRRVSCNDFAWRYLGFERTLQLIQMLEFRAVMLSAFGGYSILRFEDIIANPVEFARRTREACDRHGLAISDFFPSSTQEFEISVFNHPDGTIREKEKGYFRAYVQAAKEMGSAGLSLTAGGLFSDEPTGDVVGRTVGVLKEFMTIADGEGVPFSIEPHVGTIAQTPDVVDDLLGTLPDLKLSFDYGHFVHLGFKPADLYRFLPHARDIHCRCGRPGFVQVRIEDNEIDFRGIVSRAEAVGYAGYFTVEYVHDGRPGATSTDTLHDMYVLKQLLEG